MRRSIVGENFFSELFRALEKFREKFSVWLPMVGYAYLALRNTCGGKFSHGKYFAVRIFSVASVSYVIARYVTLASVMRRTLADFSGI